MVKRNFAGIIVLSVILSSCEQRDSMAEISVALPADETTAVTEASSAVVQGTADMIETAAIADVRKNGSDIPAVQLEDGEKISYYSYEDFDGDKTCEAFAVTDSGRLWYIKDGSVEMIAEKVSYNDIFNFDFYGKRFICFRTDDEQYSRIWGVDSGIPQEAPVSDVGQNFTLIPHSRYEFTLTQSAWDTIDEYPAHTHKDYWFYYDYEKGFCEYGGTEIGTEGLSGYAGSDEVLRSISDEGGVIQSVLRRNNSIININYKVYEITDLSVEIGHNKYITLRIGDNGLIFEERGNGVYLPALVPEIAVYE